MAATIRISLLAFLALGLSACGGAQDNGDVAATEKTPATSTAAQTPGRPGSTFEVDYDIVGTPIVGSPVSIDLEIRSAFADEEIEIAYQLPDPSALTMDEAQPRSLRRVPSPDDRLIRERVTVIPQREGRLYFNVSAGRSDDQGSTSTMISIPIHVGTVDTAIQEHGELQTNEEGETTRVLTTE